MTITHQAKYSCPGRLRRTAAVATILGGLAAAFFPAMPAQGQGDFRVMLSPNLMKVELRPGSRSTLSFSLSNNNKELPVSIRVFLKDFGQGARGQYLLSDTAMPHSCISWLELPDTLFELAPNSSHEVLVPVQVPHRAMGGAYGAVVFEIMPQRPPPGAGRLGSSVYRFKMPAFVEITIKRPGGVLKRLESGEIIIRTPETDDKLAKLHGPDHILVATEIKNTGNILVEAKGQLIIRNEEGRLIRRVPMGAGRGAILPGAKTYLRSIIKRLNPGTYSLRAIMQYGGHSPAISLTNFEVSRRAATQTGDLDVSVPLEVDVRPQQINLSAPVNAFRAFSVALINRESFPVDVDVKLGQIYHDLHGQMWTSPSADSGRAVAGWLSYEPTAFTIAPNRRQTVRVTMNVPDTASGGYYGCMLFTTQSADTAAEAAGFLPSELFLPIGVKVPPHFEYAGEIIGIEIEETAAQGATLKPVFLNTGNVHTTVRGFATIQMWAEEKSVVDSLVVLSKPKFEDVGRVEIEADSVLILPGEPRMLSSETMELLPPGRYRAKVEISFGSKEPATGEKEFVIKPSKTEK